MPPKGQRQITAMSATRERIRRHVESTPGIHFSRIGRDLDLATGQVQYHLRRLVRAGRLTRTEVAGRTHFFAPGYDPLERHILAFLRRETARELMVQLLASPRRPVVLAEELDLARSTVHWHLDTLEAAGVVARGDSGAYRLVDPELTEGLLAEVSVSLPASVVDRFMRTVDALFEAVEE